MLYIIFLLEKLEEEARKAQEATGLPTLKEDEKEEDAPAEEGEQNTEDATEQEQNQVSNTKHIGCH